MASSNHDEARGGDFYGLGPYTSRNGLIARRPAIGNNSGEIQLEIRDLEQASLDHGLAGLHTQVSHENKAEAKYHNSFINLLQLTVIKAQAALKNSMRRNGSDHVKNVILFALVCFFVLYLWSKFSGR